MASNRPISLAIRRPPIRSRRRARPDDVVQPNSGAPTVLGALGLEPPALQAVVREHTAALPGLDF